MAVVIYAIGGKFNERMIGAAHDSNTAKSLIMLTEISGGSGVSIHGVVDSAFAGKSVTRVEVSGDCTLKEARESLHIN